MFDYVAVEQEPLNENENLC